MDEFDLDPNDLEVAGAEPESAPDLDPNDLVDSEGASELGSGLRGAGQGVSMGFADEIYGAGSAALGSLTGKEGSFSDRYEQARDSYREADRVAKAANPKAYMAGEIGGGLTSALLPGGAVAKGASLAGKMGRLALSGGAQSAVYGAGASEQESLGGVAKDAFKAGTIGALTSPLIPLVGRSVSRSPSGKAVKEVAEEITPESFSKSATTVAVKEGGEELGEEVGEETTEEVFNKLWREEASELTEQAGRKLDNEVSDNDALREYLSIKFKDSKMPALGASAGGLITGGSLLGMGAGYQAGKAIQKHADTIASKAADTLNKAGNTAHNVQHVLRSSPEKLGNYARPLMEAAQRGPEALGSTHFILWKQDQNYRQMWQDNNE